MTILEEIVLVKKEEVKELRRDFSISRFTDSKHFEQDTIDFYDVISNDKHVSIIAEIKKASPSKGVIRENFVPLDIAKIYMESDIQAISILTDKNFFQGSIDYLNMIADFKTLPLLRKDFIIDEYQVYEARANGADVILLISEILSESQITELTAAANELNMNVLLEVYSDKELDKIDLGKNKIIGINNRDLHTFEVNVNNSIDISGSLPQDIITVAESGLKTKQDIDKIKNSNIDAVLVGEQFMASEDILGELNKFRRWCNRES